MITQSANNSLRINFSSSLNDFFSLFECLGPIPKRGVGGFNRGGIGRKLGWMGCIVQVQGVVGSTYLITQSAEKCPSDPVSASLDFFFYLLKCLFSIIFVTNKKNELCPIVFYHQFFRRLRIILSLFCTIRVSVVST